MTSLGVGNPNKSAPPQKEILQQNTFDIIHRSRWSHGLAKVSVFLKKGPVTCLAYSVFLSEGYCYDYHTYK